MIPGLVLGVVLGAWFLAGIDWPALGAALRAVHPGWIVLASTLVFSEWVLRGLRWWLMLHPVDPELPIGLPVSATLVGAGANVLMPLRGGDLLRPAMIAALRPVPFTVALASTLLERLFDVTGVLGILAATMVMLPPATATSDVVDHVRTAIGGLLAAGLILLILTAVVASGTVRPLVNRAIAALPEGKIRQGAAVRHEEVLIGLRSIGSFARLLACVGITAIVWTCGVGAVMAVLTAFGLSDLPIETSLFVVGSINVAIAVPQAPGFVGVFQVVVERGLSLWHADRGAAQAIAIVYWAVSFVPVVAASLFEAWRLGFQLGETPRAKILDGQSERV
jgi:uncharacterized protein (TIRG00374 family)